MKKIFSITSFFILFSIFLMTSACVRNPDGTINYSKSMSNFLNGNSAGNRSHAATAMTLPEFLKEAMNPVGLSKEKRIARAKEMNGKTVSILLPQNMGTGTGEYFAQTSSYKSKYDQPSGPYTGNVNISCEPPEEYWQEPAKWPDKIFIDAINSDPDMKISKIYQYIGNKREHFYYKLECTGREPVVLSYDDWFFRDLGLEYDLPTNKKALQRALNK